MNTWSVCFHVDAGFSLPQSAPVALWTFDRGEDICEPGLQIYVLRGQSCLTVAHRAFLSMGFSWRGYWSGLPFPPPGDLLDSGIEPTSPMSPALQADSLPLSHWGSWMILPHVLISTGSGCLQHCGPVQCCSEEHGERKSFWVADIQAKHWVLRGFFLDWWETRTLDLEYFMGRWKWFSSRRPNPASVWFCNQVLLEHSHIRLSAFCLCFFHVIMTQLSSGDRELLAHKAWNIYNLAEKVCYPLAQQNDPGFGKN